MLQAALEAEVEQFLQDHSTFLDKDGHRRVGRKGHKPERRILTGIGPLEVNQARIDDRKLEELGKPRFTSSILPRFMRRAASIDSLIPTL